VANRVVKGLGADRCAEAQLLRKTLRASSNRDWILLTHFSYRQQGFKLALLPLIMIETAFCICLQLILRNKQSKAFSEVSVKCAPMVRAQIDLNDADFLKEFSCYV
jgi:hypothetical protein